MNTLFAILSIIFLILSVISLAAPSLINKLNAKINKKNRDKTGKELFTMNGIFMIIMFFCYVGTMPEEKDTSSYVSTVASNVIPGLAPVDVYLNMEKRGFTTTKNFSSDDKSWTCRKEYAGIDYSVGIFSANATTVRTVQATARIVDIGNKDIIATKDFLLYVTSIPYSGSDPAKVAQWINNNFNHDKTSITVADVKFTIYAPSKFVRMLRIERV